MTQLGGPTGEGNVLTTERLILREVPFDEIEAILDGRVVQGANWADGYPFDGTIGGATMTSRAMEAGRYRPGFGFYQIALGETGCVIGDIGFHSAPDDNGSVEIGYGLVEAHRGKGIATEAVRALVSWTLAQPGVAEVRAETDPDRLPSVRVLLKSGFRETGSDDRARRFALRRD